MRFLFFPGGSYIGGMEIVTLSLMRELRAQGHECFAVVSGWNDGRYPAKLAKAGIPHRNIKLGRFYLSKPLWNLDGLVHFPRAARQLRSLIREFRPDVVVLVSVEFAMTVLQVVPTDLPLVLHVHAVPSKLWETWIGRYVLSKVKFIVTVSDFIRSRVLTITKNTKVVATVHNGVSIVEPFAATRGPKVRVGIVGQLIALKKHDILVDAVGLLSQEDRDRLEFRIYGSNTTAYAQEIKELIEFRGLTNCFRWMGFVDSGDGIYRDLDIVVAVAVGEAFGLTALEAASWNVPVVAARSGGFPETVRDGETGLLVEPDDPADLARALQRLMDPAERRRLGTNGRQHVLRHFGVPMMARNFVAAIESMGHET